MPTSWNPSRLTNVTLTGSNLIATSTGQGSVISVDANNTGKWYVEFTFNTVAQAGTNVGLTNNTINTATFESTAIPGVIVNKSGGIYNNNSSVAGVGAALVAGSLICIAIDLIANLAWFRLGAAGNWNNSSTANPTLGGGGINISNVCSAGLGCFLLAGFGAASDQITANFGGSAFTGAVPTGFTAGFNATGYVVPATEAFVTQVAVEEFYTVATALTQAQVTQVAVEEWISASATIPSLAIVTQVAVEEWISVLAAPPPVTPYAMILG